MCQEPVTSKKSVLFLEKTVWGEPIDVQMHLIDVNKKSTCINVRTKGETGYDKKCIY